MAENTENTGGSNLLLYASIAIGALIVAGGGYWYFVMKPKSASASASASSVEESAGVKPKMGVDNSGKIDVGKKTTADRPGINSGKIDVGKKPKMGVESGDGEKSTADRPGINSGKIGIRKFVSPEAIAKRVANPDYAGYEDYLPADKYTQFWGAVRQFVKTTEPPVSDTSVAGKMQKKKFDGDYSSAEAMVRGFLKGMNLAMKPEYVSDFKPEIEQYLNNSFKLPHWDIGKAGLFIS